MLWVSFNEFLVTISTGSNRVHSICLSSVILHHVFEAITPSWRDIVIDGGITASDRGGGHARRCLMEAVQDTPASYSQRGMKGWFITLDCSHHGLGTPSSLPRQWEFVLRNRDRGRGREKIMLYWFQDAYMPTRVKAQAEACSFMHSFLLRQGLLSKRVQYFLRFLKWLQKWA